MYGNFGSAYLQYSYSAENNLEVKINMINLEKIGKRIASLRKELGYTGGGTCRAAASKSPGCVEMGKRQMSA